MSKIDGKFNYDDSVSLRSYFETILKELREDYQEKVQSLEDKIDLRFEANKIALDKAEITVSHRLDAMNEFRNAMKDQAIHFLTKEEYEVRHHNIEDKIDALEKIVYMGIGAVFILELVFKFFIK